ncbi:MAG: sigma-54 dependent transcriptional regulator [Terracidiphilus sp.]|jgi:DNA-binding NtrC family response regulator
MQPFAAPALPVAPRIRQRTALVTSADRSFRQRLAHTLTGLRWNVREAEGGAEAWAEAATVPFEAVIVDSWLPDLDLGEFIEDFRHSFPNVDIVTADGSAPANASRGPYRQELLYAMRQCQETDTAAWNTAPELPEAAPASSAASVSPWPVKANASASEPCRAVRQTTSETIPLEQMPSRVESAGRTESAPASLVPAFPVSAFPVPVLPISDRPPAPPAPLAPGLDRLPELVGNSACMLEISRRVRLVAARLTPVLIEGPTGSGKEIVAEALHRLSTRSRKPFVAINCAAIPESLLEAELFGHTRGAFTGAVQGRTGRIEAADGGTLFLDEIGEMPLALQSKLLRFVECGELQRVGDNETVKVDVRIIAATHQTLAEHAQTGKFRSDLYYRLAVFLIRTPALSEHAEDLPLLVAHFMQQLGRQSPLKRVDETATAKLKAHDWPGNVRELEHVLERGVILAGDSPVLTAAEIDFGRVVN